MIVIEKILGNVKKEALWQQRLQQATVDILVLSQWEAQKSRCRKTTRDGQEIGISLDRHQLPGDGDVLLWDEVRNYAVVVQITLRDVMVIHLSSLLESDCETVLQTAFELGHALGNQHWKSVIKGHRIFVPITVATRIVDSVMKTHGFHALPYSFVKGETILPHLTQSEARLLFGGAEDSATHVHVDSDFNHQQALKMS
ncbi:MULTISPECIES: urease accessory protein UreE [Tenebrionibacter/Tenebrionicola group]|jgi:urease accessory protein|uniref:Urease accessory protein UreE n=2 Tax=Tenebrionibacter/Tenebrionicola group TaxID=2969848 RepID=A0A8K0XX74_9ENTR|nr:MULTISPECIES: urease accessory protein UreE [Tenebrionibacter/Tenebrionicola group]MBK4716056.1 urease accessory protein UreE [Tenebrionibacter intestinalis]MBV4411719.1 urease accessory protein UreE [Tenebrionicola larvae]MBV5096754.1 urease accessory protein UreE [Tenebrionicola larvae]